MSCPANYIYRVGCIFTAKYSQAPVPVELQYKIGDVVDIRDTETGKKLAEFTVTGTDETFVFGPITKVEQPTEIKETPPQAI